MEAIDCIMTRRSIRQFLNIPVEDAIKLAVVEAGTAAPTAGNVQDWRFVIIDEKPVLRTVSDYCLGQESVQNAAFIVVVCADPEKNERHYGLRGERLYTVQDCAAAAQNMLLAAHALGLGGVWIGAFDEVKISTVVGIPGNVRPQAILAFGYPAEIPAQKTKIDLALVTFFGKYGLRIRNVHRVTKDFHVEWEKRIKAAHTTFARLKEQAIETASETAKKTKENYNKKGAPWFDHHIKKIKEKLKPKKK
jgi:nitroreductase